MQKKLIKGFKPGLKVMTFDRYYKYLWEKNSAYTVPLFPRR